MNGRDQPPRSARRILVVASELPPGPGGIGSHAFALAVQLQRQGRDVTLLGCQDYVETGDRARFNADSPVPVRTLPTAGDPVRSAALRTRAIRRAIAELEPDVVVASGRRILWLTVPLARRAGVPVVGVVHGTDLLGKRWERSLSRRALERATTVVAVSEFTAGLARDLGLRRPIEVIPNGAEADRFAPSEERRQRFRERHGLGDRPVVLTVGNVTERKGQHQVVDALPLLREKVPDVAYVVVGRPTEAESLRAQAEALGVAEHLVIVGQVGADEVVDAHAAADVFAMTSTATSTGDVEGYGIAVVEAALSGVPAVVTSGTGAEEAVVDGVTGLAVDARPAAIADGLGRLLTDRELRHRMGGSAEAQARSAGSWEHRAERYGEVLDQVARGAKPRIVVVSHTEHYRTDDGSVVGFGATTRELDHLATLFSELVHVAPLHPGAPPGMALPAKAPNVRFVPVPPAGGPRRADRIRALLVVPSWIATINREVAKADVVHVRCPAGISMVALLVLLVRRKPKDRWVKYAGNWAPTVPDAYTYRLQRWWLRSALARGVVTVNGRWPDQPSFVRAFNNPTLTAEEVDRGKRVAEAKAYGPPFRAVFVGRVEPEKGSQVAVETIHELRDRGIDITLDLVGDGPSRPWIENRIAARPDGSITLHGWLTRAELEEHISRAHLLLLPTSASEGFPKVVAEAMAFGCVPVTSAISSMGQVLSETGGAMVNDGGQNWADIVQELVSGPIEGLAAIGLKGVHRFSYQHYLRSVQRVADESWGRRL